MVKAVCDTHGIEFTGQPANEGAEFIWEKTKLHHVMASIKAGERVKSRDFEKALEQFLRKRDRQAAVQHQGGSKIKLKPQAAQGKEDKVDLHVLRTDEIITQANWRYKKVKAWLDELGFTFGEDAEEPFAQKHLTAPATNEVDGDSAAAA